MTALQELIELTNSISRNIDKLIETEQMFSVDICHRLEQMSWEFIRAADEMKNIRNYVGGYV